MNTIKLTPPANKEPVKVARVLHYLYQGGTLNRFEAAAMLHDTCLNSTISALRNDFNITVSGQTERVEGYQKLETICQRYWLEGSLANIETAYRVLVEHFYYEPAYKPAA